MSVTDVQTVDLPVDQRDCFNYLMTFFMSDGTTPKDVSGWLFSGKIKERYDSSSVLAVFSFSQAGYSSNQVLVSLTATQTASLPIAASSSPGKKNLNKLSYDLKAQVDDGCTYTIQEGAIYVNPSVT